MARTKELDMLNGALLPKLMMFSLPLALTGILQLLFNAADVIVVGKFAGSTSLAAVGATSALINLLTGAFIGISVGVNILVARYIGCRDDAGVSRAVHSAITLSLLLGVVTFLLGFFLSTPMLELMGTPDDVLRLASLYLRIYFIGIPGALIYNFAAAILRAYGDTKRPLLFLAVSGVLNVFLNLFFVIVCRLDVAGRRHCDGRFAVCVGRADPRLPHAADGPGPAQPPPAPAAPVRGAAHDPDRPAGRTAVGGLQHLERHGAKLRQFLRRGRHRGQYRLGQHRRLHLHRDERRLPRRHHLHQPESRRAAVRPDLEDLLELPADRDAHRRARCAC